MNVHNTPASIPFIVLFLLLATAPQLQAGQRGSCLDQYNIVDNNYYAALNCTANESALSGVDLLVPGDQAGCLLQGDTTKYQVRINMNGSNTDRYDMGIYLNTYGGSARSDTTADACFQEILAPNTGTVDLLGGYGPFPEYDGVYADSCGDIDTADLARWMMTADNSAQADVDFFCDDSDNNGVMDLSGCVSYANQSGGNICSSFTGPGGEGAGTPGTKSKCNCTEATNTVPPVPIADLSSNSCSCTGNGTPGSYDCTFNVVNTAPVSLTPVQPDEINSVQPGTAAYVRFKINDWTTGGAPANGTFSLGTPTLGTASLNQGGADVLLTPQGGRCTTGVTCASAAPEDYVLGPGETTTLPFTYTNTAANEVILLRMDTYKAADNSFSYEEQRGDPNELVECGVLAASTYASIEQVSAHVDGGQMVFNWETSVEMGTLGFDVYRQSDSDPKEWIKVNDELVPSVLNFGGGSYSIKDAGAQPGPIHVYRILEWDRFGQLMELGPFEVSTSSGKAGLQSATNVMGQQTFSVSARGKDPVLTDRIVRAKSKKSAANTNGLKKEQQSADALKITVSEDGFYSISASAVATAFDLKPDKAARRIETMEFSLSSQGQEVAWEPGPGGYSLRFYGQGNSSRYSRVNTYWLSPGAGLEVSVTTTLSGDPVASLQGFSETVREEKNLINTPSFVPAPNDDFQFWQRVRSTTVGGALFTIDSPGTIDLGGQAVLKAEVVRTLGNGKARITVNGDAGCSGIVEWIGEAEVELSLPQSCLLPSNDVAVESLIGNFVLDSLTLNYTRQYQAEGDSLEFRGDANPLVTIKGFSIAEITVYDLSNPDIPKRLEGVQTTADAGGFAVTLAPPMSEAPYIAVASPAEPDRVEPYVARGLRDVSNRGNYLVIGDNSFSDAAAALIELRSTGTTEPLFVDLQHIMDEFNDGNFHPAAIRDFLRYASENWQLGPISAALVGKGHFDYLDEQDIGGNPMPPLVVRASTSYVPGDNLLGDVDGDDVPEIAIGRIPVLSPTELAVYIQKLTDYELGAASEQDLDVHLVADATDPRAGNFALDTQQIAALLPGGLDVSETFLYQPWTLVQTRTRLMDSFSEGAALVNLVGHGNPFVFSSYPHNILTRTDAQTTTLSGPGQSPMVVALSCLISTHAVPGFQSLGEDLVLNSDGGAIAVLGPLALSVNQQSVSMAKRLLPALLDANAGSIGAGFVAGLQAFAESGGEMEIVKNYSLLGDPMIKLRNQF
jgi:hypothetical protein